MRAKTCLIFRSSLSAGMTTDTEDNSMNPPHDWYLDSHQTCRARPNSSLTTAAHQRKLFYPASCPQDRTGMVIRIKGSLELMDCAKRTLRLTDSKHSAKSPRSPPRRSSPPAHAAHDTLRYLSTTHSDFDIRLLGKFAAPA